MTEKESTKNLTKSNRRKRRYIETEEGVKFAGSSITYRHRYAVFANSTKYIKGFNVRKFNSVEEAKKAACDLIKSCTESQDVKIRNQKYTLREEHYYVFLLTNPKECKHFSVKDFNNNKDDAHKAVIEYEKQRLMELHPPLAARSAPVSIEHQQFMAGFCDGDGMIRIVKSEYKNKNNSKYTYSPFVQFSQSQDSEIPEILNLIQNIYSYGRTLSCPRNGNKRKAWKLIYYSQFCTELLQHLAAHCILKANQAKIALQCWNDIDNGDFSKCEDYYQTLTKLKDEYQEVKIDEKRINPHWLCGFFDAEGCVGVYRQNRTGSYGLQLHFAQKSSPALLEAIQRYYTTQVETTGSISKEKDTLRYYSSNARPIMHDLLKCNPIVKRRQLEIAQKFFEITGKADEEAREKRKQISMELKRLKRT